MGGEVDQRPGHGQPPEPAVEHADGTAVHPPEATAPLRAPRPRAALRPGRAQRGQPRGSWGASASEARPVLRPPTGKTCSGRNDRTRSSPGRPRSPRPTRRRCARCARSRGTATPRPAAPGPRSRRGPRGAARSTPRCGAGARDGPAPSPWPRRAGDVATRRAGDPGADVGHARNLYRVTDRADPAAPGRARGRAGDRGDRSTKWRAKGCTKRPISSTRRPSTTTGP